MGLSLQQPIRIGQLATLFRDGLLLTTVTLPTAVAGVLPQNADVNHCEVHVAADISDGGQRQRINEVALRVDLSSLGSVARPSSNPITRMGFAAGLSGPLSERDAAELVAEAIDTMAIDNGYLDPRLGIRALRHELGLSA
jgi:hypothetical protein